MFYILLEGTGIVLFLIGGMAMDGNPWYVPVGFFLIGVLLILWGTWEEGRMQRWLSERRRRRWSTRR